MFDAAVAQERPPSPDLLTAFHVDIDDLEILAVTWGAEEEFALGTGDKAAAPELDATGLS